MIHYSVYFSFKEGIDELDGLARVRRLLADLRQRQRICDFKLLRNRNEGEKTRLDRFQALIVFTDDAQFGESFAEVASAGVHAGMHGEMIASVGTFAAELFEEIDDDITMKL